ncbi:MAG: pyridoxal-phosphate dependent enzyme [Gammaproteobacteria bacterium]
MTSAGERGDAPPDSSAAAERLRGVAQATPLVRLDAADAPAEIYLKLESRQPTGSFKIRTAGNQVLALTADECADGVYTASSGNLGIATAWFAKQRNIRATVLVPEDVPRAKAEMLEALGADVQRVRYEDWWAAVVNRGVDGMPGTYIDADGPMAIAGSATIGLDIVEQCPDVDTVVCSFGGGALACGVASTVKAARPDITVLGCELETATPLASALRAGEPVDVDYARSFISGMGSTRVLDSMWPIIQRMLDGSIVVSLREVCAAIRMLHQWGDIIAEGAGAAPVAAALSGRAGGGKIVCVVGGGNLGDENLAMILAGETPGVQGRQ